MFPCLIARATTTDVISSGMGGTRNGALQLVSLYAFPSPDINIWIRIDKLTNIDILDAC